MLCCSLNHLLKFEFRRSLRFGSAVSGEHFTDMNVLRKHLKS